MPMAKSETHQKLERNEQELNANAAPSADESRIERVNRKQPRLDAVLIWSCGSPCCFIPPPNDQVSE